MKTFLSILLISSVALADPPADAPLANPDAKGRSMLVGAGEIVPFKAICLDEQEDVSRERDRVEGRAGEAFWRKVAIGSITGGAVLAVTAVVVGGLAASHKL